MTVPEASGQSEVEEWRDGQDQWPIPMQGIEEEGCVRRLKEEERNL